MTFRSGGLASGIDTNSMVSQLVQIERIPISNLESKRSAQQSQLSAVGQIKSALSGLISKMKDLDSASELLSLTGSSTNEDAFTATAAGNAANASYTVEVGQLARSAKHRSAGLSGSDAEVKEGTISIALKGGTAQDVTIEAGDTLADVAARINDSVDGASATIISDGTNSYLSITSDESGHTVGGDPSDALVITETYTGGTGSELTMAETQTAQNAQVTIDGLAVESETNDVSDAISGVSIKLTDVTTKPETLTVAADTAAVEETIQGFVDAYNEALDLVNRQTTVTSGTDRTQTLAGDPTIRGLRGVLSNAVTNQIASLSTSSFDSLASIGITTKTGGKLSIDSDKLATALETNAGKVAKLFTATDGLAASVTDALEPYTEAAGILSARTDGINDSIKSINRRIDELELRVERFEVNLIRQFSAMEDAISQINLQGQYLQGAI